MGVTLQLTMPIFDPERAPAPPSFDPATSEGRLAPSQWGAGRNKFINEGGSTSRPATGAQSPSCEGILGPYNPNLSVREFGRYVPYTSAVQIATHGRGAMRRFEVDDDFTHGNMSERFYNADVIVGLNNKPARFEVPAANFARAAMVRNPNRCPTLPLNLEQNAMLHKHVSDGQHVRDWNLNNMRTALPAPSISTNALNQNEVGPIGQRGCFQPYLPLAPPSSTQGVEGFNEFPQSRFQRGNPGGRGYGLGPEFVCELRTPAMMAAGDTMDSSTRAHYRQRAEQQMRIDRMSELFHGHNTPRSSVHCSDPVDSATLNSN